MEKTKPGAILSDTTEEELFLSIMTRIKNRCIESKITITKEDGFLFKHEYNIELNKGREKRKINIWKVEEAKNLESIKFEKFRFMTDYNAIYSKENDTIKVSIISNNVGSLYNVNKYLFGKDFDKKDKKDIHKIEVKDQFGGRIFFRITI